MNLLKNYLTFLAGPVFGALVLFAVPADFISPVTGKVLAVATWMIIWWISEAIPVAVTAFLPLVFFPLLGIMNMKSVSAAYANPIIFLFLGGFLLALALEKHKLHERIALNLIRLTGTSGNGIIMGFMISTGFISLWISNTATAMMMLPIAASVINLVRTNDQQKPHELPVAERNFALGLMLMVGYAATLGGLGTIIGTPPNVVFAGLLEEFYDQKLDFGKWMIIGVPVATTLSLSTYFMITRFLFPSRIKHVKGSEVLIASRLSALGTLRNEEVRVLCIFAVTCFLWIFQEALNAYVFNKDLLNDTNVAMMGGLTMFLVPANISRREFLLDWRDTISVQWGILFLFGGGLALAAGLESAGIIQALGSWIAEGNTYGGWIVFALIVVTVGLSEVMSNVALVQIFVPVVFGMADGLGVDPVLLAMPVTLSASIGFMFPIATPPNAIVFSSGYIRMKDMFWAGLALDVISILIILIASLTLIPWVYG
ncbi:DASS family sodium-coupled anion symporter [Chryseolinea sp. T2]|uniref:SLC13 family permease n=1 Tax=Chryseolinea sp. T2 TaxID=3129255 RepID=UPI003076FD76